MEINKLNEELSLLLEGRGFIQGLKDDINYFFNKGKFTQEQEFDYLFKKYVPNEGKANTVGGEILRALGRINYRYFNDGDYFFEDYGIETCADAAIYLKNNTNSEISNFISMISQNQYHDKSYENKLNELTTKVLNYLKSNKDLFKQQNSIDMRDTKIDERNITYYFDYVIDWNHTQRQTDVSMLSANFESIDDAIAEAQNELESNGYVDFYSDDFGNSRMESGDEVASFGAIYQPDEDEDADEEELEGSVYCVCAILEM